MVGISEEKIGSEDFDEVVNSAEQGSDNSGNAAQGGGVGIQGANRPDLRVVQPITGTDGRTIYKNVGGMWKNVSKNGNEFYTLMIGNLKLLVFQNTNK